MRQRRRAASAALLLAWAMGAGCTALREIPREEYAGVAERKNVRLLTQEGLRYELDFIRVEGDTLVGFRRRDLEGPVDEFATLRVPFDDVKALSTRQLDWKRTSLIGGGVVAVLAVIGLRKVLTDNTPESSGVPPGGDKTTPH